MLCLGERVNISISQGQFNDTYPFNTYKFVKRSLKYDAIEQSKTNSDLRDKIIALDVSIITNKEIKDLFNKMDCSIQMLNSSIIDEIKKLEIKKNGINVT